MGPTEIALSFTLTIAAITDWREHRIYNKLLAPAFLVALALQIYFKTWTGLKESLIGALIGFLILLIPYFMGGMGAGDVKLLTVIGAFEGARFVVISFLFGAIIGGIISAYLLARRGAFRVTLKRLFLLLPFLSKPENLSIEIHEARQEKFPYGIAIALGSIVAMLTPFQGGL